MAEATSDNDEGSEGDDQSSDSDNEPVLAVTRERRSNAGNRMSKLLELAEAEDAQEGYGEIFQETADDVEFEAQDEDEADVDMDTSSSEDEADGAQDEDTGEKELKRAEKSKKRKRDSLLQDAMKRAAARVGPKAPTAEASASSPNDPERNLSVYHGSQKRQTKDQLAHHPDSCPSRTRRLYMSG